MKTSVYYRAHCMWGPYYRFIHWNSRALSYAPAVTAKRGLPVDVVVSRRFFFQWFIESNDYDSEQVTCFRGITANSSDQRETAKREKLFCAGPDSSHVPNLCGRYATGCHPWCPGTGWAVWMLYCCSAMLSMSTLAPMSCSAAHNDMYTHVMWHVHMQRHHQLMDRMTNTLWLDWHWHPNRDCWLEHK